MLYLRWYFHHYFFYQTHHWCVQYVAMITLLPTLPDISWHPQFCFDCGSTKHQSAKHQILYLLSSFFSNYFFVQIMKWFLELIYSISFSSSNVAIFKL
jgi:hypothetical protein